MGNAKGFWFKIVGVLALAALLAFGVWALVSWKKVPAGNVGVQVYLLGGEKGVSSERKGVGRTFIGWQQELYLYPTYTQNYVWTAGNDVGSEGNESISFQDKDGLEINADVGIAFNVDPAKVTTLFETYRKGIEEINDFVLRNHVRDALNRESSNMSVEEIYGKQRGALMDRVIARVRKEVEPKGIRVERIYWIGSMRLPAGVVKALNAKVESTQKAQQRENELAQSVAEANKAREEARGIADSTLLKAEADAKAIQIRGDALRNNPALVDLTIAEKWDGKLPEQYLGGGADGKILQIMKK